MILQGNSADILKQFNDNCIDLTITSPPYDNLRTYGGYSFDFETIAQELYRITKIYGVVVWIVGDKTENGTESGSSFKQALFFKEIGFNLHDTMIYAKTGFRMPSTNRYHQNFEYMFVLSKGKPKTFNPIIDRKNLRLGNRQCASRNIDGTLNRYRQDFNNEYGMRFNIWVMNEGYMKSTVDKVAYNHPAIFPDELAEDHIKSWSNEGDTILDPFLGSGTTYKMAYLLNRKPIGIEINPEYIQIAKQRLTPYLQQQRLLIH